MCLQVAAVLMARNEAKLMNVLFKFGCVFGHKLSAQESQLPCLYLES